MTTSIRVYGVWCVLLITAMLAWPAAATTIVMPTDEDLIEKSPLIVRGTVVQSRPVALHGGIWTETVLEVHETIKGEASSRIVIREVGGQIGDREVVVFGSPDYEEGQEVLAFLTPTPRGDHQTIDLFAGKFSEEWTIDGQRLWYRNLEVPQVQLLDQDFEPIRDSRDVQRDASRFTAYLRDRVSGKPGNPNYGVDSPRLIESFQQNFTLIGEPTVYRWFAFEDGKSVEWKGVGAQSGYAGGGTVDTQTAIASWSGYADANIRYVWGGVISAAPGGMDSGNGVNEIIFEDPLNEIAGTWDGRGGVVGLGGFNRVAGARSWTSPFAADSTHPARNYTAYDIVEGNLVIQDGVSPSKGISASRFAEILAHELGHTLGFGHSANSSALMYSSVTGLGPSLRDDDQVAARWLYPASSGGGGSTPIPASPSNLAAQALNGTTARLSWKDNSGTETSQTVWIDQGSGFAALQSVAANVQSLDVGGLQSGATYSFRITASNGSGSSQPSNTASVTMPEGAINASFALSPSSGTAGVTSFTFTDQSSGPISSWQWSFGDGTGTTSRHASHVYASPGSYTVTLTVRSATGKQSVASRSVSVNAPAVTPVSAAFTVSPGTGTAGSTTFTFTDQSTGPVASWQWSFGDGSGSSARHPSHVYSSAGTYSVTLTVFGSSGQQSSRTQQLAVGSPASPAVTTAFDVSATTVKTGQTVSFVDRSSGSPTWWKWSFGDGRGSTARNPSHAYATAGSYKVILESGNATSSSTASRTIVVGAATTRFQSLIPVTTSVAGVGGTNWRTDLTVYNASPFTVSIRAVYLPAAGESSRSTQFQLGAGRSASWQNVLGELFGLATGAGAVRFETESSNGTPDLRVSSRTYTDSPHGTYGQFVGDLRGDFVPSRLHLAGLENTSAARTNVGLVNRGTTTVQTTLSLFNRNGSLLGRTTLSLDPGFRQQSLASLFPVVASSPQAEMSIELVSNVSDAVTAYASIIDNVSQDPVYVGATPAEEDREIFIAAVGRTGGAAGTYWRSDLTLANPGAGSVSATVRFLRAGQDNRFAPGRTITLGSRSTRTIDDVMSWLGAGEGTGGLQISWSGQSEGLVATSRTYTTRGFDSGTLGQSISMAGAGELAGSAIVTGLRADQRFRTNLGLVNGGDGTIGVTLRLVRPNGQQLASTFLTVAPKSQTQAAAAALFPGVDFGSLGSFTVIAETPAPTMFAYGSVIDNQSGDPVFIRGN